MQTVVQIATERPSADGGLQVTACGGDDANDPPGETQIAHLRVLREHEFERVGGTRPIFIRNPWPGIMQTIWGSPEHFVNQNCKKYRKDLNSKDCRDWPYCAANGAVLPADGYYRILGRVDDVINVAGHRLGTKEVESACLTISEIAEAAVVPVVDEVKGRVPVVYISLKPGITASKQIQDKVTSTIETMIGKIARPKTIHMPDHAENAQRKNHAPRARCDFESHGYGRHHEARESRHRRANEQVQGRARTPVREGPADIKLFAEEA